MMGWGGPRTAVTGTGVGLSDFLSLLEMMHLHTEASEVAVLSPTQRTERNTSTPCCRNAALDGRGKFGHYNLLTTCQKSHKAFRETDFLNMKKRRL